MKKPLPNLMVIITFAVVIAAAIGMAYLNARYKTAVWSSDLPWILKAMLT